MENKSQLIPGRYYRLTKNVNAIPSGVYRFKYREELCMIFSVGKNIQIILSDDCLEFLEKVPSIMAIRLRTASEEYLERYYELLEVHSNKPFSFSGPVTACFITQHMHPGDLIKGEDWYF